MSSLVSGDEDLSRDRDDNAAGEPPTGLDIGTNPNAVQHLAAFSRTRNDANVALMVEGIVCDDFQELNEAVKSEQSDGHVFIFV